MGDIVERKELLTSVDAAKSVATGMVGLDGWRVIRMSAVARAITGHDHVVSVLRHEIVFERLVDRSLG